MSSALLLCGSSLPAGSFDENVDGGFGVGGICFGSNEAGCRSPVKYIDHELHERPEPHYIDRMKVSGGCHCGAVRFRAELPEPPVRALDCNCSICRRTGFLHIIVPHEAFALDSGADRLTSYRFGTGAAEHLFCTVCGVKSFYQPRSHPEAWSVNAHCLDEAVELAVERFDGANWEQARDALE